MKKLAMGALCVGLLAACGNKNPVKIIDSAVDTMGGAACNLLTQTGCNAGEKCTWIVDQTSPQVGHVGCAPNGTVAVGAACMYTNPPNGSDNCQQGLVCLSGVCKTICDQAGGAPMCDATHSCQVYTGFLGPEGSEMAGVCDPTCDPIQDNKFGSANKVGSGSGACGSADGCYGYWSSKHVTHFSCARVPSGSTMLFHRSMCTTANGCANKTSGNPYLNGCASGYMPYVTDFNAGMNTFVCLSFCVPTDCYTANPPNLDTAHCGAAGANRVGAAPVQCKTSATTGIPQGTFNGAANGDQCLYGWNFGEVGSDNMVLKSPYSNTTGFCWDHTKYTLADSTGMMATTTPEPACPTLPISSAGSNCYGATATQTADLTGCDATNMGCVSTTTGNVPTHLENQQKNIHVIRPRAPYHSNMAPPELQ